MYRGKCPNCGAEYRGWALGNPGIRYCSKCSKKIEVSSDEAYITALEPGKKPKKQN